ncbi:hypothetical protein HAX54_019266, partial [Datura stramonium]|nr:hypothetical protein [Datura stramonium]
TNHPVDHRKEFADVLELGVANHGQVDDSWKLYEPWFGLSYLQRTRSIEEFHEILPLPWIVVAVEALWKPDGIYVLL